MAYAGARGNTKAQISDVIAGGASYDDIINHFSWLMKQLSTPAAGYNLSSANRLFVADDFDILQSYKKLINDNFGGQLQQINFARPAEAANEINDWVKNETNSRITEIVNEEILNGFVSIVLANALYFKAEWQHQFNPNSTINQIFFVNENEQREVCVLQKVL
ncbi:Serpin B8 [Toxocara canis]|uniref:Serpin B8 n=1 Tax=Toxocara canis TaxID=6265 RepID=A0A0B2V7C7_TOXCA|nr:Serpin B8 [Toxocara canis]